MPSCQSTFKKLNVNKKNVYVKKNGFSKPLVIRYIASVAFDWTLVPSQLKYGFYVCKYYEQNSKIPTDVPAEWRQRTPYAAHFGEIRPPW